jgi:hypothetical protein
MEGTNSRAGPCPDVVEAGASTYVLLSHTVI